MDLSKVYSHMDNSAQIHGTIKDAEQINSVMSMEKQIKSDFNGTRVIAASYTGAETDNIIVTVDNGARTISATNRQIQYESKLNFPTVGSEMLVYIDVSENATYRWDSATLAYVCIGRDYGEIEIINGGNA